MLEMLICGEAQETLEAQQRLATALYQKSLGRSGGAPQSSNQDNDAPSNQRTPSVQGAAAATAPNTSPLPNQLPKQRAPTAGTVSYPRVKLGMNYSAGMPRVQPAQSSNQDIDAPSNRRAPSVPGAAAAAAHNTSRVSERECVC